MSKWPPPPVDGAMDIRGGITVPEWILVTVVGAIGGFLSTFLPAGTAFPSPPIIKEIIGPNKKLELL